MDFRPRRLAKLLHRDLGLHDYFDFLRRVALMWCAFFGSALALLFTIQIFYEINAPLLLAPWSVLSVGLAVTGAWHWNSNHKKPKGEEDKKFPSDERRLELMKKAGLTRAREVKDD